MIYPFSISNFTLSPTLLLFYSTGVLAISSTLQQNPDLGPWKAVLIDILLNHILQVFAQMSIHQ